jgi:replicative DNA helicase
MPPARRKPGAKSTQRPEVFDRTPPQNIEAERSVLGAMLLNPDVVGVAIEVLHDNPADTFYVEAHQHIYEAILALYRGGTPVDVVTLVDRLVADGNLDAAGGASYLAELTGAVPTSANTEYYARIVMEKALLRRIISACTGIAGEAYREEGEVAELLDRAESEIFSIAEKRQLNPMHRVGDLLEAGIQRIEQQMRTAGGVTGLATGFHKLDEMLSGLQPSDMIILAARPSVGKTAFCLNIAAHVCTRLDKGCILFSLEMSKEQLVQRLLCMEGQVDSTRLRTGFLARAEFPKLQHAAQALSQAPLYIDDTPNVSILEMRSKARRHRAQGQKVDLIIIDYLQLMTGSSRSENRQTEIADISRAIKALARELSVPVIALSQLSREAEKDDSGSPKLSHLRESGAIEQDADVVLMLSRMPVQESEGRENVIRLNVAKQRNGPTGPLELLFEKNIQRFRNLTDSPGGLEPPPAYEPFDETVDAAEQFADDDIPFD